MALDTLTAIVLCKDEARTLDRCLRSLSFCHEIIVADDGSIDDSLSIARKHQATIIHLDSTTSFAHKRNQALEHAFTPWALFIDADEYVSPDLSKSIQSALLDPKDNGYKLSRRDEFLGKKLRFGETGQTSLLRLGKVGTGTWKRRVHEVWDIPDPVGAVNSGEILHTPHPTLSSFFETINHYTTLEVEERFEKKEVTLEMKIGAWIDLLLLPLGKFVYFYFFRLGFCDGIEGFIHAYCMSLHSLLVRIKVLEYIHSKK